VENSPPAAEAPRPISAKEKPSFGTAFRYWLWLGCVNFGGPAGQIALMHDDLVDRRKWVSQQRFMHALNYCNLLPGPEAMQLATYIGWLLHGTWGGLAAGVLFVLPGAAVMTALSIGYACYGELPWLKGLFYGLGPGVIAIVAAAVLRIGGRSLRHVALIVLAGAAFVAIFFFSAPFPAIIAASILIGLAGSRWRPEWFKPAAHGPRGSSGDAAIDDLACAAPHTNPSLARSLRVIGVHLVLWGAPIVALGLLRGWGDLFVTLSVFFSIAAMVTFGGAYAVLSYVAQAAVNRYHWLTAHDMTVGLGLDEPTPGPLILIVQFVGFLAGHNHPPAGWSSVGAGLMGTALTLWVTFVPCFLWIFLGAPFVERLRGNKTLDGALTAVTAAVVGVILNLAIWLALRVLFTEVTAQKIGLLTLNIPTLRTFDSLSLALAVVGFIGIVRFKWNMIAVILGSATVGIVTTLF
jgi:chromate transporter